MANVKITDLPASTDPVSTDVLPIVDVSADATKKVSIETLLKNASNGTESAPSFSFDGDGNTGIYHPAADQVAISTNGVQRILIEDSGVTVPGNFTVNGTTTTIDTTTLVVEDKNIEIGKFGTPTDTTADGGGITLKGATDKTISWVESTGCWTFNQPMNFNNHVRIDSSGNVGIGTTTPSAKLDVDGQVVIGGDANNGTAEGLQLNSSGFMQISRGSGVSALWAGYTEGSSTQTSRINNNGNAHFLGNVGIGTSSPLAKFHIARGSDDNSILYITGADTNSEAVALGVGAGYGMLTAVGSGSTSTDLIFRTANSGTEAEAMRIDSSGNVGISNAIPGSFQSGGRNLVVGANSAENGITIYSTT